MLVIIFCSLAAVSAHGQFTDDANERADTIRKPVRKFIRSDSIGRYLTINRVIIVGNKLTKNSVILRELSLRKGVVVDEYELTYFIEKDRQKLFNLRLFNKVSIQEVDAGNDRVDILIELNERWYTFPVPRFQLSDRNFNEWWETYNHDWNRVNYGLKLYQYNVWGRNQTLILTAQFGYQKRFELSYRIPYINKKQKQGLIFDMDFIEAKNVADSTLNHKLDFFESQSVLRNTKGIGLTYTYRNNFYNHHRLKYEYRKTSISDTLQKLNPNYLGPERTKQQFDALTYEFISDHRDVISYPLKGYQFTLNLQQIGIAINKDVRKSQATFSFAKFVDLKKNFFLSNFSSLQLSTPDKLPYYNYGAMGYNKILVRGYELYVIESPAYFLNKTTLKKRIFSRTYQMDNFILPQFTHFPLAIYLKAYTDFGYTKNYTAYEEGLFNTRLSNKFLSGGGLGIDFVSAYDVVLRIEYTFTTEKESGFFFHITKEF
jgi:outer membrane protein assembly factor BamA